MSCIGKWLMYGVCWLCLLCCRMFGLVWLLKCGFLWYCVFVWSVLWLNWMNLIVSVSVICMFLVCLCGLLKMGCCWLCLMLCWFVMCMVCLSRWGELKV